MDIASTTTRPFINNGPRDVPLQKPGPPAGPGGTLIASEQVFDIITHHNQTLDVVRLARQTGRLRSGAVLIHVDAHSDIGCNTAGQSTIADYVNALLRPNASGNSAVSEVYWVIPDWLKNGPFVKRVTGLFWGDGRKLYELWVDKSSGKVYMEKPAGASTDGYSVVRLHKLTLGELEQALPRKDSRDYILDVDFDYFSNNGFGLGGFSDKMPSSSASGLKTSLEKLSACLAGIKKPSVVIGCRSPEYTEAGHIQAIEAWFTNNFGEEAIPDTELSYAHTDLYNRHLDYYALYDLAGGFASSGGRQIDEKHIREVRSRGFGDIAQLAQKINEGTRSGNTVEVRRSAAALLNSLEPLLKRFEEHLFVGTARTMPEKAATYLKNLRKLFPS